jgi:hypothetical protein
MKIHPATINSKTPDRLHRPILSALLLRLYLSIITVQKDIGGVCMSVSF